MRALLVAISSALLVVPATEAQPAPRTLRPADAKLAEEFTKITAIRELADGRVLISDERENRLIVANLLSGAVSSLGAVGSGPGEFEEIGRMFPLPNDSTLLVDHGNGARWLLLSGARIVGTIVGSDAAVRAGGRSVRGADGAGNILKYQQSATRAPMDGRTRTELVVLRVNRLTTRVDTVTRAMGSAFEMRERGSAENMTRAVFQVIYAPEEPAVMFLDGWIAIARLAPYRIDWHSPNGDVIRGMDLPWLAPRVSEREKEAWAMRAAEQSGKPLGFDLKQMPWAEVIPPVRGEPLIGTPGGEVLVPRAEWTGARGAEYDLIDRRGALVASLTLGFNERIVGAGVRSLFVAVRDDDGIERLERRPWR